MSECVSDVMCVCECVRRRREEEKEEGAVQH